MKIASIERELRTFIVTAIPAAARLTALGVDDRLFELSLFDSAAILETITFCEERFGIELPEDDLIPENFETIRHIARMIDRMVNRQAWHTRLRRRARELTRWRAAP
jgi:acyl carrier protein